MNPLTDDVIRKSFVNCSKGEASRINLPKNPPWPDLDFLGWRDPGAPDRGYVVTENVGITLRLSQDVRRSFTKSTICSICLTPHAGMGVALFTARRIGAAGKQGNTVGTYMCADLACSLYVRDKKQADVRMEFETLSVEERIARATANLESFLNKVMA